jgi:hypothetical protein
MTSRFLDAERRASGAWNQFTVQTGRRGSVVGRCSDRREEVKLPVLLTGAHERATPPITYYNLGSYRASTSITSLSERDLQQGIADLGVLRNQLVHTQSVFVTQATTFDGVQPISVTLALPGREYLPNQVEMGGIAETFVAGTSRSVPAIGAAVGVTSYTTTQATCLPLAATSDAYDVSLPLFDWDQQFTTIWPSQDVHQYPLSHVPLEYGAPLSESSAPRTSASVASREVGTELTAVVELRLDTVPGLRKHLRRLIGQRRTKLRRALKRRQAVAVRLPRPRPVRRNLTLALLAVSYRFGRRSEPDDHAFPAHRSTSVIGGEPAISC